MSSAGPEEREPAIRREAAAESARASGVQRRYQGEPEPERRRTLKAVERGSAAEASAGAAGVVLAIIGIAGTLPAYMEAIATIAIGVAFLAQGAAIATRWSHIAGDTAEATSSTIEIGNGISAELVGGGTAIVLGILALIGVAPSVLLPVALLVFGGTLLLSTATEVSLGSLPGSRLEGRFGQMASEATMAASGMQLVVAIAAIVLGIVALLSANHLLVTLIGLLVVGASILLSGAAMSARMMAVGRHQAR